MHQQQGPHQAMHMHQREQQQMPPLQLQQLQPQPQLQHPTPAPQHLQHQHHQHHAQHLQQQQQQLAREARDVAAISAQRERATTGSIPGGTQDVMRTPGRPSSVTLPLPSSAAGVQSGHVPAADALHPLVRTLPSGGE